MKSFLLSNKIFFIFLITLSSCGVFRTSKSKAMSDDGNQFGAKGIVWDKQSIELAQKLSSVVYRLNYKMENEEGELVNEVDLITLYPRDSNWTIWDIKPSNQLPQVLSLPLGELSADNSYNIGFPVLTPMQVLSLKENSNFNWVDPITLDTINWELDKSQTMGVCKTMVDGDSQAINVINLKNGAAIMQVIPAYKSPIIAGIAGLGYSYQMEDITLVAAPDDLTKPGVLAKNAILHYTASSAEGVMSLQVKILKLTSDTVVCLIMGDVDDSYKYTFNNIVIYAGLAYTEPQFLPFLPSLILDSLFYKRDGMCFISPQTVNSWINGNGGLIGMDHFEMKEIPVDDMDIAAEIESQVQMQYYRKGKMRDHVNIKLIDNEFEKDLVWPIEVFANYNTGCFLDIIPFKNVGVVYRASSTDMMWNIKLEYISLE
jgi:hypothetical protein